MRIIFVCYHPVEPHLYANIAKRLSAKHSVSFLVLEKEGIEKELLDFYGFHYDEIMINKNSKKFKAALSLIYKFYSILKKIQPGVIVSATSPFIAIAAKLLCIPTIGYTDTETASFNNRFAFPFFNCVLIPAVYYSRVPAAKSIRYSGYKEFAYLHPNQFKPDGSVLEKLKIGPGEKIVLLRFSALKAMHDIGLESVADSKIEKILYYIKELDKSARVFVSMTEKDLGPAFEKYRLRIHPAEYTNFLAHCTLYIGEGTTTASEAGVLGVPWVNIQKATRGYLIDQEENYGLGFRTDDIDFAFKKGLEWLQDNTLQDQWKIKREKLLKDKIDVTAFFTWFIENYPESFKIMKENPSYEQRFK